MFDLTDPVRAKRRGLLQLLLRPKARPGIVAAREIGRYSGKPLHIVFFTDGKKPETAAFFEHELTAAPDLLAVE